MLTAVQSLRLLVGMADPYGVLCYCVVNRGLREWLAAPPALFTPLLAVFQSLWQPWHQEVAEVPKACFEGLLGTDRGTSYGCGRERRAEEELVGCPIGGAMETRGAIVEPESG